MLFIYYTFICFLYTLSIIYSYHIILYSYHVLFHVVATRPCYTFHSSYSYLYYRILSCYMLSSCTFCILHIHLYVLILSFTLCFRIFYVPFLCWLKADTFISYLYYKTYTFTIISYTVICFHICFHVLSYSVLSYHILSCALILYFLFL